MSSAVETMFAVLASGAIASAGTDFSVPSIDLSLLKGSEAERASLAEQLRSCCHDGCGFFYLCSHGVDNAFIDSVSRLAQQALSLSEATKAIIDKRNSPHFRGWEQVGSERTGGIQDMREQIDTWSELEAVEESDACPPYKRLLGPNQFFDDDTLPGYKELTLAYHERMSEVARQLLEAFSLALELPPDALDQRFGEKRMSLIKYIRYPPTPAGGQGVGLHQDSAYMTLLLPGEEAGLECMLPNGQMMSVGRKEGCFVVNLGEALQQMTGNVRAAGEQTLDHAPLRLLRRPCFLTCARPRCDSISWQLRIVC